MKNYLDLVPISAKIHRRQDRMTVVCIILSVLLITGIFSIADVFVRSQISRAIEEGGNWHIALRGITDKQASWISMRPDVKTAARYGVRSYSAGEAYTLGGKEVVLCGSDEAWLTDIMNGTIVEGRFPQSCTEVLVTQNARNQLGLQIGSAVTVKAPDGTALSFTASGFIRDGASLMSNDSYGIFMNTEGMRKWLFPDQTGDKLEDFNSLLCVRVSNVFQIQRTGDAIKDAYSLADDQIMENTKLTGLLGQSGNSFMTSIYATACILAVLVILAGVLMISGSLNSIVVKKTEFYGMVRCIGATPKQVKKLVRREALQWCKIAIPAGLLISIAMVWLLCAVLRYLSPEYFGTVSVFTVSLPGVAVGAVIGLGTVMLAARIPAKRASKVSPLSAVSGYAGNECRVRRPANTRLFKIETSLGIFHATGSKRNFLLMSGSYALSIVLFLAFSVMIAFMHRALTPLQPWAPDISLKSADDSLSLDDSLFAEIQSNPSVRRAFGRRFAYQLSARIADRRQSIDIISYDSQQFRWAVKYLMDTPRNITETVEHMPMTGLAVYQPGANKQIKTGDTVNITINGEPREIQIVGILSNCPFDTSKDAGIVICSEETFARLTGQTNYTVIDIQLTANPSEQDIDSIRELIDRSGNEIGIFSDRRLSNRSVKGVYYSFNICVYGFLAVIALIAAGNILNSIAMSVAARTRQYGTFQAIGLSRHQLSKMIIAEAAAYTALGCMIGTVLGMICNKYLFASMITNRWGDSWRVPWAQLSIILLIVLSSVAVAVYGPIKRLHALSIVDTINVQE